MTAKRRKPLRNKRVDIRCTDEEREIWQGIADEWGINLANLIRTLLKTSVTRRGPDPKRSFKSVTADPELVQQIAQIGNTLNIISQSLNEVTTSDIHLKLLEIDRTLERVLDAHQIS